MKRSLTTFFLIFYLCISQKSLGQIDTVAIQNFVDKQIVGEAQFIYFLKNNNIDSCMTLLSKQVVEKYGSDSMRVELKRLNKLFQTYFDVKNTPVLGQSSRGVGTFGHDHEGNYELSSLYQFYDNDKVVYHFTLYYNDSSPADLIKYYDSWEFSEFKNLRLTK